MSNFYITTTLPYVNAPPHLGFAWEILTADFIARYQRALGNEVIFNTGTDEHGQKIYEKAQSLEEEPQIYVDKIVSSFTQLQSLLNLSYTNFVRTTDQKHQQAAQKFWQLCQQSGDIYKKHYQLKYCTGCEMEKTESELTEGHCPLHPHLEIELREEENYFFRFSRYQEKLLALYHDRPDFIIGQGKMLEIISFVKNGLQDFSISRVKEKMPWGVPVPGDEEQVMYVWFDALVNYLSTLDWPENDKKMNNFWPAIQICGKDNLRQQAAIWQSMLMSANFQPSKKILINGFIFINGQKMSKSLGNIIAPNDLVTRYGQEATRFLIASFPVYKQDVDLNYSRLDDNYTATLVNGLGNLASRLAKLASSCTQVSQNNLSRKEEKLTFSSDFSQAMVNFDTHQAWKIIIDQVHQADQELSQVKPWLIDDLEIKTAKLAPFLGQIRQIAFDLQIFMPKTSQLLLDHFSQSEITPLEPLFPRLKKA